MRSNPNCNGNRRDKAALGTTCIKNVKSKSFKGQAISMKDTFTTVLLNPRVATQKWVAV